ncbi:hypothetical protein T484DRAFT_1833169, partial [Baffinella frigidus]
MAAVSFPLFNFFSYATTPMVARALARDDPREASRLVAQGVWLSTAVGITLMLFLSFGQLSGIWLSTAVGITLMLFLFFNCDGILRVMGANAEIFPFARQFLLIRAGPRGGSWGANDEIFLFARQSLLIRAGKMSPFARQFLLIRAFSAPAELWLLVAKGASYGHQNTKAPLQAIATGSAVHLALDFLFILVMKEGLAGAAMAVVISQYTATLMLLRSLVVAK